MLPSPKKAILIRVGVDQSFGQWNGPCNRASKQFLYVPIPESLPTTPALTTRYDDNINNALLAFNQQNNGTVELPTTLQGLPTHLDPDYDHLTYGDTNRRGKKLLALEENDWVVFYSGLRDIQPKTYLTYALTGLLVVKTVSQVKDIPESQFHKNAHTRQAPPCATDIVVQGKKGFSGRFKHFIDIGSFRNGAYRVREDLLAAWGDLTVNDGWIQRSANPPLFKSPNKFADWLHMKNPELIAKNF